MDLILPVLLVFLGAGLCVLIVRVFPNVLGEVFLKRLQLGHDKERIDHQGLHNQELARQKDRHEARTSDTSVSAGLITSGRSIRKQKEIESLESMWRSIQASDWEFADLLFYEWILTAEELDEYMRMENPSKKIDHDVLRVLKEYRDPWVSSRKHGRVSVNNSEVLFVGLKTYGIYNALLRTHARFGTLISWSLGEEKYSRWQEDKFLQEEILVPWLPNETIQTANQMVCGGLAFLTNHLKGAFILQAQQAITGHGELDDLDRESASQTTSELRHYAYTEPDFLRVRALYR